MADPYSISTFSLHTVNWQALHQLSSTKTLAVRATVAAECVQER